ncbi:hypothetical protein H5410_001741 [Solanum commersonii]|uniref:Uncharacterized protein n=1 Tax=Solanum commersonii TaxID=4109 RepID=A0A9J6AZW6_SOLCO|nr:hypothetical protein H5410_001741 [Solanum commersonii]
MYLYVTHFSIEPFTLCVFANMLIKLRGQLETLCAKCSSKLFDLVLEIQRLSILCDARPCRDENAWWGRGSLGPMEMMTSTQA